MPPRERIEEKVSVLSFYIAFFSPFITFFLLESLLDRSLLVFFSFYFEEVGKPEAKTLLQARPPQQPRNGPESQKVHEEVL